MTRPFRLRRGDSRLPLGHPETKARKYLLLAEEATQERGRIGGEMMEHHELDFISRRASWVDGEFDQLRKLVGKHKVCWEVWPEYHIDREGKRIQIGFELNLIGSHDHSEKIIEPGCTECMKIYEALSRIAHWIIPREEGDALYEMGIFDASIHYSSQRRFRPEIILTVKILHKKGFDRPTDASEVQSLKEMEEKLERLGARKGNWGSLQ